MARPLRLEIPGALYHITARGDRQEPIFEDDEDRRAFLELLAKEVNQQGWLLYAFCLMDNHYHLLLETPEPTLVRGMRRLNGVYTQALNRRHGRAGRVLRGRYQAIVVDKDRYLLELCRYVVLNPVRARLVASPAEWPWSSYRPTAENEASPKWLAVAPVLALFAENKARARRAYTRFVADVGKSSSPWTDLKGQIFLGSEAFHRRMGKLLSAGKPRGVPRRQLGPARPSARTILREVAKAHAIPASAVLVRSSGQTFKQAVYLLRRKANLSLREVAALAGVSIGRVSQIQTEIESTPSDEVLRGLTNAL